MERVSLGLIVSNAFLSKLISKGKPNIYSWKMNLRMVETVNYVRKL